MKNNFLIFFAFAFAIVLMASGVAAQPINTTNYTVNPSYNAVQVQSLEYTPYPVNPGSYFDIWVEAQIPSNENYARFELQQTFPFSVDNASDAVKTYNNVAGRTIVMHFKVRVSQDAVVGVNELKLAIYPNSVSTSALVKTFNIYVSNVQTSFDLVVQDSSNSQVSLAIANTGENTANSMIVRIPEQPGFRITGTNGQMVGNLNAGDYSIASFNLVPTGRDSRILQVEIDYTDSIGVRRQVFQNVTFFQGAAGNFTTGAGNGTRTFSFNGRQVTIGGQSRSIFQSFWFWLIVLIVVVGGFYLYRHPDKRKKLFSKFGGSEKSEKKIRDVPEWVSSESKKKR